MPRRKCSQKQLAALRRGRKKLHMRSKKRTKGGIIDPKPTISQPQNNNQQNNRKPEVYVSIDYPTSVVKPKQYLRERGLLHLIRNNH